MRIIQISLFVIFSCLTSAMEKPWIAPAKEHVITTLGGFAMAESICYSPNGKFLAAGTLQKELPQCLLKVWDTNNLDENVPCAMIENSMPISCVDAHPNNKEFLTANLPELHIWDLETGKDTHSFKNDDLRIFFTKARYNSDGSLVLAAMKEIGCRIYDVRSKKCYELYQGSDGRKADKLYDALWSPDSMQIAASTRDKEQELIHIWDVRKKQPLTIIKSPVRNFCLAYQPQSNQLAAGSLSQIAVYDTKRAALLAVYSHIGEQRTESLSYEERKRDADNKWDDAQFHNFSPRRITCLQFSPKNSDVFVAGTNDGYFNPCDTKDSKYRLTHIASRINALAMHPDGQTMAASVVAYDKTGEIRILDTSNMIPEKTAEQEVRGWGSSCGMQ